MSDTEPTGNSGPGPPPTHSPNSPQSPPSIRDGGGEHRRRRNKLGHRRVTLDGTVTYKKTTTSEIRHALQLGIRQHIDSIYEEGERDVLNRDFQTVKIVHFPPAGSTTTPSHELTEFRFRSYAPVAFRNFRKCYALDINDFVDSLCKHELRELSNPGASGSIFFMTQDDEFIVKTVLHREGEFLRSILPYYFMHLMQHPRTLLPKFHGFYLYQTVRKNIRFIVMNNLLPTVVRMHERYDLKGSTYKRRASAKELAKNSPTLKDLDFRERHPDGIWLEAQTHSALISRIERDCTVLESLEIMDYSLLLGIHNLDEARRERTEQVPSKQDPDQLSSPLAYSGGDESGPTVNNNNSRHNTPTVIDTNLNGSHTPGGSSRPFPRFPVSSTHSSSNNRYPGSPGADGETMASDVVFPLPQSPPQQQQTNADPTMKPTRRLAAFCTAMEMIKADAPAVELKDEEQDLIGIGGIPARNSNGERLLLFIGIIDILQSYQLLKKLEHGFKALTIDKPTLLNSNTVRFRQAVQRAMNRNASSRDTYQSSNSGIRSIRDLFHPPYDSSSLHPPQSTNHNYRSLQSISSTPPLWSQTSVGGTHLADHRSKQQQEHHRPGRVLQLPNSRGHSSARSQMDLREYNHATNTSHHAGQPHRNHYESKLHPWSNSHGSSATVDRAALRRDSHLRPLDTNGRSRSTPHLVQQNQQYTRNGKHSSPYVLTDLQNDFSLMSSRTSINSRHWTTSSSSSGSINNCLNDTSRRVDDYHEQKSREEEDVRTHVTPFAPKVIYINSNPVAESSPTPSPQPPSRPKVAILDLTQISEQSTRGHVAKPRTGSRRGTAADQVRTLRLKPSQPVVDRGKRMSVSPLASITDIRTTKQVTQPNTSLHPHFPTIKSVPNMKTDDASVGSFMTDAILRFRETSYDPFGLALKNFGDTLEKRHHSLASNATTNSPKSIRSARSCSSPTIVDRRNRRDRRIRNRGSCCLCSNDCCRRAVCDFG